MIRRSLTALALTAGLLTVTAAPASAARIPAPKPCPRVVVKTISGSYAKHACPKRPFLR
jgi:hypothetical protein